MKLGTFGTGTGKLKMRIQIKMRKVSFFLYRLSACLFFISAIVFFSPAEGFAKKAKSNSDKSNVTASPKLSGEVAIGEQIDQTIMASFYAYTEPEFVSYVNQIGKSISDQAERKDLSYRFTVLYSDKIYAASAPGGHIYLTTGLVYFLDNESELAAVIAHEVGELQYKDPRLSKARKVLETVLKGGTMIGPAFGEIGALATLGLAMVKTAVDSQQKSLEQKVLDADDRAMNYMTKAGYDPQAYLDVFNKFLSAGKEAVPYFYDYYKARPITVNRIASMQQNFQALPLQDKTFETNRGQFLEMSKGIKEMYRQ